MTSVHRLFCIALVAACSSGHPPGRSATGSPLTGQQGATARPDASSPPAGPVRTTGKGNDAGNPIEEESVACEDFFIPGGRLTPDMLIVLDRSSSMKGMGVDRWTPSVQGLKAITKELQPIIRFGLMAFPGRGTGGGGGILGGILGGGGQDCAAGSMEVPIALNNAAAIGASLDGLELVSSTPTEATIKAAHAELTPKIIDPDAPPHVAYVILITDGSPNCGEGGGGRGGNGAVDATVAAIKAMAADDIKTYVLGFGTATDPNLKSAMDMMAVAGGTGDKEHRPIENEANLVAEFRKITGAAASCSYALEKPPTDEKYVLVKIDQTQLNLGDPNGFSLSSDHKTLMLQGKACEMLKSETEKHSLSVEVRCEIVNPS